MKLSNENTITPFQLTCMLIGSMIGLGILYLASDVGKNCGQNGWIAVIIGAVYPFFVVMMASYIQKKYPDHNILMVNRICFGKYGGWLLNFALLGFFVLYGTSIAAGIDNLLRTYVVPFLNSIKILIILMLLACYTSYKGLKILGRTNEMLFYLTLALMVFPFVAFVNGWIGNMMPFFDVSPFDLIKGSMNSAFSYGGVEIILLVYSDISDKRRLKSAALKAVLITMIIYTLAVFITTYYLDTDLSKKVYWPFLAVTKTVEIPIINNFRLIFMVVWSVIIFKTISNNYYSASVIVSDLFNSQNYKKASICINPLMIFIPLFYGDELHRRELLGKIIPWYTLYIIIYLMTVVIFIHFKSGGNVEKQ